MQRIASPPRANWQKKVEAAGLTWHTGEHQAYWNESAFYEFTTKSTLRWRREFAVLFMGGWFAIVLAPVLPLANHMSDNYPTIPGIGLAWLAGWAIVSAWRSGALARTLVLLLVGIYGAGSIAEVDRIEAQQVYVTARMRALLPVPPEHAKRAPAADPR